jgi:hypothetical protein
MYYCFTRNWWTRNPNYPGGKEPRPGRKYTHYRNIRTEEEAQRLCKEWNETHDPGPLSKKMEYDEQ